MTWWLSGCHTRGHQIKFCHTQYIYEFSSSSEEKIDLALVEQGELWISICFQFSPEAFVRKGNLTFRITITVSNCQGAAGVVVVTVDNCSREKLVMRTGSC